MARQSEFVCPFARLPVCLFKPANRLNGPTGQRANGQSILEYVILITVLGLLILALRGRIETAVNNLYDASADKVDEAAENLRGM